MSVADELSHVPNIDPFDFIREYAKLFCNHTTRPGGTLELVRRTDYGSTWRCNRCGRYIRAGVLGYMEGK